MIPRHLVIAVAVLLMIVSFLVVEESLHASYLFTCRVYHNKRDYTYLDDFCCPMPPLEAYSLVHSVEPQPFYQRRQQISAVSPR